MRDPVSWLVVERGWSVYGSDGERLGDVQEIVGDPTKDIFNGIAVTAGLFSATKYVPSERVDEIVEGRVTLHVTAAEFERLLDYADLPQS